MFGRRIKLFNLLGFEVRVDASWLIIAVLITWSLATTYYPSRYPDLLRLDYWWMGIVSALALFASIVIHEFFHSLVARRHGIRMEGITLFIFGGVAEMADEPHDAKTEFLIAIVGPIASVVAGAFVYFIYRVGKTLWPPTIIGVVGYLYVINLILAGFNLIPAFPLDGGRVLRSALWYWNGNLRRATRTASLIGAAFGGGLMLLALWQLVAGNFIGAMWFFLIGTFLRGAAQSTYAQILIRNALEGEPVRRFMKVNPVTVPSEISLQELVDEYIYRHHYTMFPVISGSQTLAGCVTTAQVKDIPCEEWDRHSVQEILQPCSPENTVGPGNDVLDALSKMSKSGLNRLMVVDSGHLEGVIAIKDLVSFLTAKLELEGDSTSTFSPPKWLN